MAFLRPEDDQLPELGSFYDGGPRTVAEAFPPVCLKTHWNPTAVTRHILPDPNTPYVPQVFDPRPHARICTGYYDNSQGDAPLPEGVLENQYPPEIPTTLQGPPVLTDGAVPMPPGGAAGRGVPYSIYAAAVDQESDVYRLDERLTKCKERRYQPRDAELTAIQTASEGLWGAGVGDSEPALVVTQEAGCRQEDDQSAWNRSARLFFNHTKLDRYHPTRSNGSLSCSNSVAPAPTASDFTMVAGAPLPAETPYMSENPGGMLPP
jgi:hypothetical protein